MARASASLERAALNIAAAKDSTRAGFLSIELLGPSTASSPIVARTQPNAIKIASIMV